MSACIRASECWVESLFQSWPQLYVEQACRGGSPIRHPDDVQAECGVRLPATVVIDCPTIAALAHHITALHQPGQAPATLAGLLTPRVLGSEVPALIALGPLHSCGRAGQGSSRGPGNLNGMNSSDAVGPVPLDRWDMELQADAHALSTAVMPRFGSFLVDPGSFDPAPFGLSSAEAALMDPQQRLLLECIAEASPAHSVSNTRPQTGTQASVSPAVSRSDNAARTAVGVFVGIASSDYSGLLQRHTSAGGFHATACAPSVASGRLSFAFGFGGPSVSVGAL